MKKVLLTLISTALVAGVFAQGKDKPMVCAVMKEDKVDIAKATKSKLYSDYKGKRYFFCCAACKPTFEKDPAKYAKTAPSIPTPTKKKGK